MFFLEINAMILSPLFVEAWHAVDFRRTLLDFIKDDKLTRENLCLNGLYYVLIRKQPFSDERHQSRHGGTLSHQQNTCKNNILN